MGSSERRLAPCKAKRLDGFCEHEGGRGVLCKYKPIIMRAVEGKALVGCHFSVWQRSFLRFARNTGWAKSPSLEFAHYFQNSASFWTWRAWEKACCIDKAILNQLSSENYESSDVDIHVVLESCFRIEG